MAERKVLARSTVNAARSMGSNTASMRLASMRLKSSSVLTSFSSRRPLRCTSASSWRSTVTASSPGMRSSMSSSGLSISVSGVRQYDRLRRRGVPGSARLGIEAGGEVVDHPPPRLGEGGGQRPGRGAAQVDVRWRRFMQRGNTARAHPLRAAVVIQKIGESERQIVAMGGEAALQYREHVGAGLGGGERGGEFAQGPQAPFADHPLGIFDHHAQHTADIAVVEIKWAVRKRVISLFGVTVAFEKQQQRLIPGSVAVPDYVVDAGTDGGPDFAPHVSRRRAERPGMFDAEGGTISVIIKKDEFRSPAYPHRIAGAEHDLHRGLEPLWPAFRPPHCGSRPVLAAHQRAEFTAAVEEVR